MVEIIDIKILLSEDISEVYKSKKRKDELVEFLKKTGHSDIKHLVMHVPGITPDDVSNSYYRTMVYANNTLKDTSTSDRGVRGFLVNVARYMNIDPRIGTKNRNTHSRPPLPQTLEEVVSNSQFLVTEKIPVKGKNAPLLNTFMPYTFITTPEREDFVRDVLYSIGKKFCRVKYDRENIIIKPIPRNFKIEKEYVDSKNVEKQDSSINYALRI